MTKGGECRDEELANVRKRRTSPRAEAAPFNDRWFGSGKEKNVWV
jgi:hypothetical protein